MVFQMQGPVSNCDFFMAPFEKVDFSNSGEKLGNVVDLQNMFPIRLSMNEGLLVLVNPRRG